MNFYRILPLLAFMILFSLQGLYAQINIVSGSNVSSGDSVVVILNLYNDSSKCYTPYKKEHIHFESTSANYSFIPDSLYYDASSKRLNLIIKNVTSEEGLYEISIQKEPGCKVLVENYFDVKRLIISNRNTVSYNNSFGNAENAYRNNSYKTTVYFLKDLSGYCNDLIPQNVILLNYSDDSKILVDSIGKLSKQIILYYTIPKNASLGNYKLILWPGTNCSSVVGDINVKPNEIVVGNIVQLTKGSGKIISINYRGPKLFAEYCTNIDFNNVILRNEESGMEILATINDISVNRKVEIKFDIPFNAEFGDYKLYFRNSCIAPLDGFKLITSFVHVNYSNPVFPGHIAEIKVFDLTDRNILNNCVTPKVSNFTIETPDGVFIKSDSVIYDSYSYRSYFSIPAHYKPYDTLYFFVKDSLGCYENKISKSFPLSFATFYNLVPNKTFKNEESANAFFVGDYAIRDRCFDLKKENLFFTNDTTQINIDNIEIDPNYQYVSLSFQVPKTANAGNYKLNIDKAIEQCNGRIISGNSYIQVVSPSISIPDSIFVLKNRQASEYISITNSVFLDITTCQYNWNKPLKLRSISNGKEVVIDSVRTGSSFIQIFFTPNQDFTFGEYEVVFKDNCGFLIDNKIDVKEAVFDIQTPAKGYPGTNVSSDILTRIGTSNWAGFHKDSLYYIHELENYYLPVESFVKYSPYSTIHVSIPSDAPRGNYHLVNKDSLVGTFSVFKNALSVIEKPVKPEVPKYVDKSYSISINNSRINQLQKSSVGFSLPYNSAGNFLDTNFCLYPKKDKVYLYNKDGYKLFPDTLKINSNWNFTANFSLSEEAPLGRYQLMIENDDSCKIANGASYYDNVYVNQPYLSYFNNSIDTSLNRCDNRRVITVEFNTSENNRIDTLEYYRFSKVNTSVYIEKYDTLLYADSVIFKNSTLYTLFRLPKQEYLNEELNFSTGERIKIDFKVNRPWLLSSFQVTSSPVVLQPGGDQVLKLYSNSWGFRLIDQLIVFDPSEKAPEMIMEHESKLHSFPFSNFIKFSDYYSQLNFSVPSNVLPGFYYPTLKYAFCDFKSDVAAISSGDENTVIQISTNGIARPGGILSNYAFYYYSGKSVIKNAKLKIVLNNKHTLNSGYSGWFTQTGDTLIYSIPELIPGKNYVLNFNTTVKTTATLGDTVSCNLYLDVPREIETRDNYASLKLDVRTSFDPNDKLVNRKEIVFDEVNKNLIYTIRFQNTGNDTAFVVRIEDRLDARFDFSTIKILSHSHPMDFNLSQKGELEFIFKDILLPDSTTNEPASNGYVSFSIKLKEIDFTIGDSIANQVSIFFDYNDPVITEYAITKIVAKGIVNSVINDIPGIPGFLISPNPVKNQFSFSSPEKGTLYLYDNSGVLEFKTEVTVGNNVIKVLESIPNGFYTLLIETENLNQRGKIVISN